MSFFLQKNLAVMLSREQIHLRVGQLGTEVTHAYLPLLGDGAELVVIGILKGSFVFLADLVRVVDLPLVVEFIGLSSYGDATESSGVVQLTQDLSRPIAGKHVLVIEDIVDTGLTMKYLFENLTTRHPASIKLACLLEKPSRNVSGVRADFLGFSIEDRFVVGYGLDFKSLYRNLPFVGVMKS